MVSAVPFLGPFSGTKNGPRDGSSNCRWTRHAGHFWGRFLVPFLGPLSSFIFRTRRVVSCCWLRQDATGWSQCYHTNASQGSARMQKEPCEACVSSDAVSAIRSEHWHDMVLARPCWICQWFRGSLLIHMFHTKHTTRLAQDSQRESSAR